MVSRREGGVGKAWCARSPQGQPHRPALVPRPNSNMQLMVLKRPSSRKLKIFRFLFLHKPDSGSRFACVDFEVKFLAVVFLKFWYPLC